MKLIDVTSHLSRDIGYAGDVRLLYERAFPADERRLWEGVRRVACDDSAFTATAVVADDGALLGFITSWDLPGFIYIEHFAIAEARRGAGLGGAVLAAFLERCGARAVVLEAEPSGTTPMAARRIAFYQRAGFTARTDYRYVQPPYAPGLAEVPLTLMVANDTECPPLERVEQALRSRVYGQ